MSQTDFSNTDTSLVSSMGGNTERPVARKESHKRKDSGFAARENVKKAHSTHDYWNNNQVVSVGSFEDPLMDGEDDDIQDNNDGEGVTGWSPQPRTLLDVLRQRIRHAATEALDEYDSDILASWQASERRFVCEPADFLESVQKHVTPNMRSVLVDWMVEVCEEYKLSTQTLFLSVHYLDRLLSQLTVVRAELQLVGIVAMFVACKYEEKEPMSLFDFVFVSDHTYSKASILEMEKVVLNVLRFRLSNPTPHMITARLSRKLGLTEEVETLAHYAAELFLQEPSYAAYLPSVISLSAIFLGQYVVNHHRKTAPSSFKMSNSSSSSSSLSSRGTKQPPFSPFSAFTSPVQARPLFARQAWNKDMAELSRSFQHELDSVKACIRELHSCMSLTTNCHVRRDPLNSVRTKYENADKCFVQRYSNKMDSLPWPPPFLLAEKLPDDVECSTTPKKSSNMMDTLTSPFVSPPNIAMELSTPLKLDSLKDNDN